MDQELKELAKDERIFGEMKEYMLDHFGSTYSINPEEGFFAIYSSNKSSSKSLSTYDIKKKFQQAQDEFFHRFWCEELMPLMDQEALEEFFNTFKCDLGKEFFDGLKKYLNKVKNACYIAD
jgi:hypothetical protein